MQRMPQWGMGSIETTRENVIVTRLVVKSLPGQLEVDRIDRGGTPRQILYGSLYVYQRTTVIHTAHMWVEDLVAQMQHVPQSSSVVQ